MATSTPPGGDSPDGRRPRAANELTITDWDPVSKQPILKVAAVSVTKIADADGQPAPAPTNTASAPASNGFGGPTPPETVGHGEAEVTETFGGRQPEGEEKGLVDKVKDTLTGREESG